MGVAEAVTERGWHFWAAKWGWKMPGEDLMGCIELTDRAYGRPIGEVVALSGLIGSEDVERLAKSCPEGTALLGWIVQNHSSLGPHRNRLMAAQDGVAYYGRISPDWLHPDYQGVPEINHYCASIQAVLLVTDADYPVLGFVDMNQLRAYTQAGRKEQSRNPLIPRYPDLRLAIVSRQAMSQGSHLGAADGGQAVAQNSASWSAQAAVSEPQRLLARILDTAIELMASDIKITPDRQGYGEVRYRVSNDMCDSGFGRIAPTTLLEMTRFLTSRSGANPSGGRILSACDGQLAYRSSGGNVFIRGSFIPLNVDKPELETVSCALRLLPNSAQSINFRQLSVPDKVIVQFRHALQLDSGLILMVGPTSSGKSSTIAAAIDAYHQLHGNTRNILSLEQPIERELEVATQFECDPADPESFKTTLRALMRHDPDMIWIGEIRDELTARVAVRGANTGHMVLSTLHANHSIAGIHELYNMVERDQRITLIESLALLASQRLVKELCPVCRGWKKPDSEEVEFFEAFREQVGDPIKLPESLPFNEKGGCGQCNSGYVRRIPIFDMLPVTRKVKDLLHDFGVHGYRFDALKEHRLMSLHGSAFELLHAGVIPLSQAMVK